MTAARKWEYFQSVGQGSINISWHFTGASIAVASGIDPFNVQYVREGIDTVWQKIEGDNYADPAYIIVQVSGQHPAAAFSWSPDGDCGNVPVQFMDLSSDGGLVYSWNFSDGGTSNLASPSYAFLDALGVSGTHDYPVTLTVLNKLAAAMPSVTW
jgi:hypothetical protein